MNAQIELSGAVQLSERKHTEAKVLRLHTSPSGREITGVAVEVKGEPREFSGDVVVVACGAVNSTLTIIANALRVGDHLLERFGVQAVQSAGSSRADMMLPEMAMA